MTEFLNKLYSLGWEHLVDIGIVSAYLLFTMYVGLRSGKNVKTLRQFAISDRKFSTPFLVGTIFATVIGATSILSRSERIFTAGMIFIILSFTRPISTYLVGHFIAPRSERFMGLLSIGHIMGALYGKKAQLITGIAAGLDAISTVACQVTAIGFLFNYFLGISFELGVFIGYAIIIGYTAFGGMKSVVTTDFLQFLFVLVILPAVFIGMITYIGDIHSGGYLMSLERVFQAVPQNLLKPFNNSGDVTMCISLFILWVIAAPEPSFAQRLLIAKSTSQARKSMLISAVLILFLNLLIGAVALMAHGIIPEANPNTMFIELIDKVLPIGVRGVAVAGLLAAVMSTADSDLNVVSTTMINDIILPFKKENFSEKTAILLARISTVLIGMFSILMALKLKNIFAIVMYAYLFLWPIALPPLLAGFFYREGSSKTFLISSCSGLLVTCFWKFFLSETQIHAALPGIIANGIVFLLSRRFIDKLRWNQDIDGKKIIPMNFRPYKAKATLSQRCRYHWHNYRLRYFVNIYHKGFYRIIRDFCDENFKNFAVQYLAFPILAILTYVGNFFMTSDEILIKYNSQIFVRFGIGLLCAVLLLKHFWHKKLLSSYAILYYLVIMICTVIMPTFWLFQGHMTLYWILNSALTTVLLGILVKKRMFFILWTLGNAIAILTFHYSYGFSAEVFTQPFYGFYGVFFSFVISVLFASNQEKIIETHRYLSSTVYSYFTSVLGKRLLLLIKDFHGFQEELNILRQHVPTKNKAAHETINRLGKHYSIVTRYLLQLDSTGELMFHNVLALNSKLQNRFTSRSLQKEIYCAIGDMRADFRAESLDVDIIVDKSEDIVVPMTKGIMSKLVGNLLDNSLNAFQFRVCSKPKGEINIWIEINPDGTAELHFKDNAGGMNPDVEEQIFEGFFDGSYAQTGLGLAYCQKVMQHLDGYITCKNEPRVSVEFILHFPDFSKGAIFVRGEKILDRIEEERDNQKKTNIYKSKIFR